MGYKTVSIPFVGSIGGSVASASASVLGSLEAYRKARRGERVELLVPDEEIREVDELHGTLMLRWREEIDLACRMERVGEGLGATVAYRVEGGRLVLEMLDEAFVDERFDEL